MYPKKLLSAYVLAVVLVLSVFGGAGAQASSSGSAVAYQIDVAHDGVQVDPTVQLPFARRWTATLPDAVSYPLIAAGYVFVTASAHPANGTVVEALDQVSGATVWSHQIAGTYHWSGAAYDGGAVFVLNSDGLLSAFAATDGAARWSIQLPGQYGFHSTPTADAGVVYVQGTGTGGTLYAVDERDGHLLVVRPLESGGDSSPTLSDSELFLSNGCNHVYAFSRPSLAPIWSYREPGCFGGGGTTSVYAAGTLFAPGFPGNLAFDALSGSLLGSWAPYGTQPQPVTDGKTIWRIGEDAFYRQQLIATDVASGATEWTFQGDGSWSSFPILVDTTAGRFVAFASQDGGHVYAVDASTGALLWSDQKPYSVTDSAGPIPGLAAGAGLLVVTNGKQLIAYDTDTTAPVLTVPDHVSAQASSPEGALVTYEVSASDPDNPATVSCLPASGSLFPIGTTTVTCTATDTVGNAASASFNVIVEPDTTAPTITVPPIVTAAATSQAGATVTYSVSASDPDDTATIACTPRSGSQFPVGTTIVTCTATDGSGNAASASFPVVVSAPGANCNLSDYTATKGTLNLKNANLSGCYLPGANLAAANATNANFAGAYLDAANLSSATLSQADLERAVLTRANLTGAKLNLANLTGASLTGTTLTSVTWSQTTCPDGTNSNNDGGTCLGHLS